MEFVGGDDALQLLNDAGLAERFAKLLVAYHETGLYDRAIRARWAAC